MNLAAMIYILVIWRVEGIVNTIIFRYFYNRNSIIQEKLSEIWNGFRTNEFYKVEKWKVCELTIFDYSETFLLPVFKIKFENQKTKNTFDVIRVEKHVKLSGVNLLPISKNHSQNQKFSKFNQRKNVKNNFERNFHMKIERFHANSFQWSSYG